MTKHSIKAICVLLFVSGALANFIPASSIISLTLKHDNTTNTESQTISAGGNEAIVSSLPGSISFGASNADEQITLALGDIIEYVNDTTPAATFRDDDRTHYLTDMNNITWKLSKAYDVDLNGMPAKGVNMTGKLPNDATVHIAVLLFEEDGQAVSGADVFNITAGAMKLNVEISGWPFCASQTDSCFGRGTLLDLDLDIQALADKIVPLSDTTFSLGRDAVLMASSEIEVDGESQAMTKGYPRVVGPSSESSGNILRLRFPRFEGRALWDAVILLDMAFEDVQSNNGVITITNNDEQVNITSTGGQVSYDPSESEAPILVSIDRIIEMSKGRFAVGQTADPAHSASGITNLTFNTSSPFSTEMDGVSGIAVNMTSPLANGARLDITVFVYEHDGNVALGEDDFNVTAGSVQITYTVSNWTFCNAGDASCESRGDYLETAFTAGSLAQALRRINLESFAWGPDSILFVDNDVDVDGAKKLMPAGYPAIDANSRVVAAIPRFNESGSLTLLLVAQGAAAVSTLPNTTLSGPNNIELMVTPNGQLILNGTANAFNVSIEASNIREIDSSGNLIAPSDPSSAGQHLQAGLNNAVFQISPQYSTMFSGVRARGVNSTTVLLNGAIVRLTALVFEEAGTVTNGFDIWNVTTGSLKFNVHVSGWPFCGSCKTKDSVATVTGRSDCNGQSGYNLDLDFVLRGFCLGENGQRDLVLTRYIEVDHRPMLMESGFPQLRRLDGTDASLLTLRIPRFEYHADYDALVIPRTTGC